MTSNAPSPRSPLASLAPPALPRTPLLAAPLLAAALVVPAGAGAASPQAHRLTVVQLNDVYEVFPVPMVEPGGGVRQGGGMARVATLVRELRGEGPVLLLHAGDIISPSLLSTRLKHRGAQMIKALNALELDAATFGNHEFDYGCQAVLDRLRQSRFPWVSANVDLPPAADLRPGTVQPTLVVERDGLRVGLFGVTLPLEPVTGCGPLPITFRDPVAAAREAVAALRAQGAEVVVGLTHLPLDQDRRLAEEVAGIDLIVGGHDHQPLDATVGETLIAKAGANAVELGLTRLTAVAIPPPEGSGGPAE